MAATPVEPHGEATPPSTPRIRSAEAQQAWLAGDWDRATRIYAAIRRDQQPRWAADVARVAVEVTRPPEWVGYQTAQLQTVASNAARWTEARVLFNRVRALGLKHLADNGTDDVLDLVVSVIEQAAKIIYNATDPQGFGTHTGEKFVVSTAQLARRLGTEAAATALWNALTPRPPHRGKE